jgi:hypothetical protein
MLSVTCKPFILSVVMPNVVMMNVVMLSVVAPFMHLHVMDRDNTFFAMGVNYSRNKFMKSTTGWPEVLSLRRLASPLELHQWSLSVCLKSTLGEDVTNSFLL